MNTRRASSGAVRATFSRQFHACMALALLPMACALLGVAIDERLRLGYSNWLSACRGTDVSLASVAWFTLELLPTGVIGLLLGGLAVQVVGVFMRRIPGLPQLSLAAHAGCGLGMGAGLLLCTLTLPLAWMLGAEALLAAFAAGWLFRRIRKSPYPDAGKCVVGLISAPRAAPENFRSSGR